jgi:hypothetical protein
MRISPPVVLVLVALVVGSVIAYLRDHSGPSEHDAEQAILDTYDSTYGRRDHAECVRVDDSLPWKLACTFQQIGLHGIDDTPLQVMAVDDVRAGHPTGGRGGVSLLPIRCAGRVRCWVRQLCRVNPGCPPLGEVSFPTLGRNAAPRPLTAKACVHAWNVHGGFTPEEASIERPAIPSPVFTGRRPIYTPHLAAAALGFIASRTAVRVTGGRCSVAFDLGARRLYRIDSRGKAAPRFWMWVGRRHMDSKPSRWVANACQRRDGTLSVGHDCPAVAGVAGRDVLTELKRGVLDRVAEMGGIPYWLGASFHGAVAQPRRSRPPYQTIAYTLRYGNERVTLRVVTGSGTARPPVDGVPVIQVSPQGTPVLVVADRALLTAEQRCPRRSASVPPQQARREAGPR